MHSWQLDEEGAIKMEKEAGFMAEILDELARRAGFTWYELCWISLCVSWIFLTILDWQA